MTIWTNCRAVQKSCRAIALALLVALKESIQPQGARGLYLQQAATTDWALEEAQLNICMVCELFVQILASGLGALALVWATVVLLGGFSTSLDGTDFWVITAIVFIQTARVVGINVSPEAAFFNQVPPVFLELGRRRRATSKLRGFYVDYINIMSVFGILVLAVPTIAGLSCISLSIYRLMALLSIHHVNSNVFRALMLFYALVVLQGGLFIIWFCMRLYRSYLAYLLRLPYRLDVKRELVDKYMDKTFSTAIQNGVPSTINMNLASFALDLIRSDYSQDHIEAVYLIHTLTAKEDHRTRTLSQIQSSPLFISRLLDMVTPDSPTDQRTKICIAEIVVHLASNLDLADISGATESISSMIDPYFTKISTPATNANIDHQTSIDITNDMEGTPRSSSSTSGAESKPLIIYGLLILAKLAVNPGNCKQIYDYRDLFFKIISPVKNKVYEIPSDDGITMEITEKALEVVSKLVSGKNETSEKICRDISCNIAFFDIRPIMERDHRYNKLKVPATKILTQLYSDRWMPYQENYMAEFIKVLMNIFLDAVNESGLRKTVGKALVVLALHTAPTWSTMILNFSTGTESSVLQLLTAMIPEESNRLYRTAIAQLVARFLANLDLIAERKGLESIKTILPEVLKVMCNVEQAGNTNQECSPQNKSGQPTLRTLTQPRRHNSLPRPRRSHEAPGDSLPAAAQLVGGRRKSLAAFLGLAIQICDKLKITADDFDTALVNIPLSMGEFVDKLNDIIEQCKVHSVDSLEGKRPSVDYLVIINNVTKLCLWMMDTKPDCIKEFQDKNTSAKLQGALEDMRDLELGMILTGNVGDVAHYQTLSTMVAAARQKMDDNVLGMSG